LNIHYAVRVICHDVSQCIQEACSFTNIIVKEMRDMNIRLVHTCVSCLGCRLMYSMECGLRVYLYLLLCSKKSNVDIEHVKIT
jgi:hypothetical protein